MEASVEQTFPPPAVLRQASSPAAATSSGSKGRWSLTRSQWFSLVLLALGNMALSICSALQAPFFPREAELKGTTPAEYGLVFGLFYLTNFIFAPVFGKLIPITGPDFLRDSGMFVVGGCFIVFALLDKSPPGATFLALAYLIRIMEGIGCAAYKTSNFAIVAATFPDQMATAMGVLETAFGFGLIIGPTIGGLLYEVGGFPLPFVSSGCVLAVIALITVLILPKTALKVEKRKPLSAVRFLGDPLVLLYVCLLSLGSMCVGFNQTTLEPHLRQFHLSAVGVGMMFIFTGGFYSLSSSLFGYLVDKNLNATCMTTISCLFIAIGYSLIGPVPFLGFDSTLWLVALSLVLFGVGFGGVRVVSFVDCLRQGIARGYDNDMATYGLVSGVFNGAFGIGYFIGPTLGGVCFQYFGYRRTTTIIAGLGYLLAVCFVVHLVCEKRRKRKLSRPCCSAPESCPLLSGSGPWPTSGLTNGRPAPGSQDSNATAPTSHV